MRQPREHPSRKAAPQQQLVRFYWTATGKLQPAILLPATEPVLCMQRSVRLHAHNSLFKHLAIMRTDGTEGNHFQEILDQKASIPFAVGQMLHPGCWGLQVPTPQLCSY